MNSRIEYNRILKTQSSLALSDFQLNCFVIVCLIRKILCFVKIKGNVSMTVQLILFMFYFLSRLSI